MKINIFQKGFNYSQDGQGNRLVYHLQGCNLHCPWCANPEGIAHIAPLFVEEKYLINSVCPHGAIADHKLDRSICKTCTGRECININKNKGIVLKCTSVDVDDLVKEILESSSLFFDGGGVTLTGGEPTQQFEAVKELLIKLKEKGINTAIETNGTCRQLPELYLFIDQLIMDFKHGDSDILKKVTGLGNEVIKENILAAANARKTVNIRIPLISRFNTSDENLHLTIAFFRTLNPGYFTVELLKFHEFGKDKWKKCGMEYQMDEKAYISREIYQKFKTALTDSGFKVINT